MKEQESATCGTAFSFRRGLRTHFESSLMGVQ
jgi:hypothetical protein